MESIDSLEKNARFLIQQPEVSLTDLRRIALEFEELINSQDYQVLANDDRERLQGLARFGHVQADQRRPGIGPAANKTLVA